MIRAAPMAALCALFLLAGAAQAGAAAVDPRYGDDGRLMAGNATAVVALPGDRLAVAGPDFSLALYDAGGRAVRWRSSSLAPVARVTAMAAAPDGGIVLAGGVLAADQSQGRLMELAVARFTRDGLPDTRFGQGGLARVPGLPAADAVVVQPDGAVVAGMAPVTLVRFGPSGEIDSSFGTAGRATVRTERRPAGKGFAVGHLLADGAGRLTAFGRIEPLDSSSDPFPRTFVARFDAAGTWADPDVDLSPARIDFPVDDVVASDDGFVATGALAPYARNVYGDPEPWNVLPLDALARPVGRLPRQVALTDGLATTLALGPGGDVMLAGYGTDGTAGAGVALLTRVTATGRRDLSFGACGTTPVTHPVPPTQIVVQRSGRILVIALSPAPRADPGTIASVVAVRPDGGRPPPSAPPVLPATIPEGALEVRRETARRFEIRHRPAVGVRLTAQLRVIGIGEYQYVPLSDRNLRRLRLPRVVARARARLVRCREGEIVLRVPARLRARLARLGRPVALELRTRVASPGGALTARKRVTLLRDGSLTD